jgi:hypothetical protein
MCRVATDALHNAYVTPDLHSGTSRIAIHGRDVPRRLHASDQSPPANLMRVGTRTPLNSPRERRRG